jgi:hypothetical protein
MAEQITLRHRILSYSVGNVTLHTLTYPDTYIRGANMKIFDLV